MYMYANISTYIFVSQKKKYLLAVHNFWIFFSLLLPPRWIFQSIPKIFTSSQELFVGNLHIHRCCVFCWKTKRKGEKMKAFYGNINIKYTVMRVQWSISSRFFFHKKFCQSPYRLYWFSYVYENHKHPIRVLYPIIRIFIYQTKNFKWYILRSSYTTTEFMLRTFKRSFLCSSTLESSMYIARSKNWKK